MGEEEKGRIKLRMSSPFAKATEDAVIVSSSLIPRTRASEFAKASSDKDGGHGESERIEVLTINRAAQVCDSNRVLRALERNVIVAGVSEQLLIMIYDRC